MQIVLFTFCFVYKPSTFYRFIRYAKYNNYANYSITAVKNMLETLLQQRHDFFEYFYNKKVWLWKIFHSQTFQ